MSKKYDNERLENACARAYRLQSCSYTTVANILKNGIDLAPQTPSSEKALPMHENVRGKEYYA